MGEVFGKKNRPSTPTHRISMNISDLSSYTKSLITCIFSDMRCADASHSTTADAVFGLDVDLSDDTRFGGWAS